MPKLNGLSIKQLKFIDAYLGEAKGNGSKAAQLAGYRGSSQTLKAVASENLAKPDIANEIEKRLQTVMNGEEVLQELSAIAGAECREPVRVGEKLQALQIMAKHHKLLTDKVETESIDADPAALASELAKLITDAVDRLRLERKLLK